MEIVNELKLDMLNRSMPPVVNAVQDDSMTRKLKIEFYEGATAWNPADFDRISIAFLKPDGKRGWYDTLPNHSPAVVSAVEPVSGKLVSITATLAPEVLTTAGKVDVAIIFQDKSLNQIATFPFIVDVAENPANNQKISNDYYNVKNLTEINAELTRLNGSIISLEEETSWNYADSIRSTVTGKELSINDISRNRHMVICEVSSPTQRPEKIKVKVVTPDNPQGKIFAPSSDGKVTGVYSGYPTMQITTNTPDAMLKVVYNVDTRKFVEANASGGSGVEPEYVNNNFANVIKETITGTTVSTDMVSPVEHDVVCKIGRINLASTVYGDYSRGTYAVMNIDLAPGKWIVKAELSGTEVKDGIVCFKSDNSNYPFVGQKNLVGLDGKVYSYVIEIPEGNTGKPGIAVYGNASKFEELFQNYNVTLSRSGVYAPYIPDLSSVTVTQNPGGKTFKPNAEGIVAGMKSTSPSMTITTDNSGANLEVTYNVDTGKFVKANSGGGSMIEYDGAGYHNSVYRGKNLGSAVTSEQYARIKDGTFKDLYIGDYWKVDGVNWRIASFDYFLKTGDIECIEHHAVIVPDTSLYSAKMNSGNTTSGGYIGSDMHKTGLNQAKSMIQGIFANHVLNHRIYLTNSVSAGAATDGIWADSEVDLMNERTVYGCSVFSPVNDGSKTIAYIVDSSQFSLFSLRPDLISNRQWYWLRDVVRSDLFANVNDYGDAHNNGAARNAGVRPFFCIYGGKA